MSSVSLLELPESVLLRVFWFLGPVDLYTLSRLEFPPHRDVYLAVER